MTEDIRTISGPVEEILTERQQVDYTSFKEAFIQWLSVMGKKPNKAKGYAHKTVSDTSYRVDQFYRWIWSDGSQDMNYTTTATVDSADDYMRHLVVSDEDYSNNTLANHQKSIKRLFKWMNNERGRDIDWDPDMSFNSSSTNPRDFLTIEERRKIREAALDYGSIPAYNGLTPEERDTWKVHLAQRFDKPKYKVSKADWDEANGWKVTSIVWTSLDTGLRPIEVERATTKWVDVQNKVLRIPKEESSKNVENWVVSITDRTASALDRWIDERELYDRYDGTDALWLTREGNPYGSTSLGRIIKRLCKIAEIPIDGRQMSWYTIRHSLGTAMTGERDLKATQAQLRHKSPETTMKYDQVPVEDRRDALDRIG
jgi:site-specific recombinase XerD